MGNMKGEAHLNNDNNNNNNNNNNTGNIDDILDILHKKKEQDKENCLQKDDAPTRIDNQAVKPKTNPNTNNNSAQNTQKNSSFEKNFTKRKSLNTNVSSTGDGVHLSDFNVNSKKTAANIKAKKKFLVPGYVKVIIYLAIVISVSCFLSVSIIKISNDVFAFIKPDKEITITIDKDDTLSDVSQKLFDADIIEYPTVYKMFSKFRISKRSWLSEKFIEGEHTLNPSMNYDQIINALCLTKTSTEIIRVTIPEGYTVYEILDLFEEKGVIADGKRDEFISAIDDFDYDYQFMDSFDNAGSISNDRLYRLEGYLFPDTYDFYVGENAVSAIDKLLTNFNQKFDESWYQRADDLGFSVDEIIILASMIEAEGNTPEDFAKISSVFHNRLNNASSFPFLDSDACVLYSFQGQKKTLDKGDTKNHVHPYNTYLNRGLPPGPICSPGYEAIYAALYPESTNYYYFLTMSNGETVYSKTLSEHNAAIAESNRLAKQNNSN